MARYLVERDFGEISDEEMLAAAVRSDRVAGEHFPDVTWEHSHVCATADGSVTTFCVYEAETKDRVLAHANAFGGHVVTHIYEIVEDVTPAEVRRRAAG